MPSAKNGQADSKVTNKIGPSSRAPKQGSRKTKKTATGINSAVLNADDKNASTSSHQTSTSSDNEKIAGQKIVSQIKPKQKSKHKKSSKTRKKRKTVKEIDERIDHKIKTEVEETEEQSDDLCESLNDTLRWDNVCSDSEEEIERLRTYKENRRKRYIEALQVKIVKRISQQ